MPYGTIKINPEVFRDKRSALAVAWNEAIRLWMEEFEYEPESEPTKEQKREFEDTAYAEDPVALRKTILARIITRDDSVPEPTREQLEEAYDLLVFIADTLPEDSPDLDTLELMAEDLLPADGSEDTREDDVEERAGDEDEAEDEDEDEDEAEDEDEDEYPEDSPSEEEEESAPPGMEGTPSGMEGTPPGMEDMEGIPPGMEGMPPGMEGMPPGMEGMPPGMEGVPPGMEGVPPGMEGIPPGMEDMEGIPPGLPV